MESGGLTDFAPYPYPTYPPWQIVYDKLVDATNCTNSSDTFECLRTLPIGPLYSAIHSLALKLVPIPGAYEEIYGPVIDGTFITDYPSKLLAAGKFVKIPTIIGVTTDEASFIVPSNLNLSSDAAVIELVESKLFSYFFAISYVGNLLSFRELSRAR